VRRALTVAAMAILLVLGTILVFMAFDKGSHSVTDTIRPFVITVTPVWIVAIWAARIVLRHA
jgi:hypothetical protein